MKRSDMLLKLMESMIEAPEDIEQAADYLLSRLEKAGMLPPLATFTKKLSDVGPGSISWSIEKHVWEREDA